MSSTCPHNLVNFGRLTAEIGLGVRGTPAKFNGFASWQRYCTASSSGHQPNFAALNRGRHLCSAGQPSRWALAHILGIVKFSFHGYVVCMLPLWRNTIKESYRPTLPLVLGIGPGLEWLVLH